MRRLIFSLFASTLSGASFAKSTVSYNDQSVPLLDGARAFKADIEGIDIVGADVGPLDGRPLLLLGGFTYSYPYLRKMIESLVEAGFRVFVYNPPGQGRGELESGRTASPEMLGIDGMLKVFPAMRRFAYEQSGGQKVTVVGHSLGGLQVRFGSMGVIFDNNGVARISREAAEQARRETALIVPMFSMALIGKHAFEDVTRWKSLMMKDVVPFMIDCVAAMGCFMPTPIHAVHENIMTQYLKISQNNLHKGLFGSPDLDTEEVDRLGKFVLPQNVRRQIRKDFRRWLTGKEFSTSSGYDLGRGWQRQQRGERAIPTLYIAGEHDSLTSFEPFVQEAMSISSAELITVETGHLGAFFSETMPAILAEHIGNSVPCRQVLRAKARPTYIHEIK